MLDDDTRFPSSYAPPSALAEVTEEVPPPLPTKPRHGTSVSRRSPDGDGAGPLIRPPSGHAPRQLGAR